MTRKSRIEPRKNLSFLSENDFGPKILPNAKNRQISQTGKTEFLGDLCCDQIIFFAEI